MKMMEFRVFDLSCAWSFSRKKHHKNWKPTNIHANVKWIFLNLFVVHKNLSPLTLNSVRCPTHSHKSEVNINPASKGVTRLRIKKSYYSAFYITYPAAKKTWALEPQINGCKLVGCIHVGETIIAENNPCDGVYMFEGNVIQVGRMIVQILILYEVGWCDSFIACNIFKWWPTSISMSDGIAVLYVFCERVITNIN